MKTAYAGTVMIIVIVAVSAFSLSVGTVVAAGPPDDLEMHLGFLKERLDDVDSAVQSVALDALATYDITSQLHRVRKAVSSSSTLLKNTGLFHIKGRADQDTLEKAKEIVLCVAPKANEDDGGFDSVTESLAVRVLLASNDAKMQEFAVAHMRSALKNDSPPFTRWACLIDTVAENRVASLMESIKESSNDDQRQTYAVVSLAQLGDKAAIEKLKLTVASGTADGLWWRLSGDTKLLEALDIDLNKFRSTIRSHPFQSATKRGLLLAYFGEADGLLPLLRRLGNGSDFPIGTDTSDVSALLVAAGKYGDGRFVQPIKIVREKTSDGILRLECSAAIVQIIARDIRTQQQFLDGKERR